MTKRPFESTDIISSYYEAKQNLESAHKKRRIFTHPTSKSKLIRQHMNAFIENHNSRIDTQITDEIDKLIDILKRVIIDNNISKLQELISHGILDEINETCLCDNDGDNKGDIKYVITEIIGCILKYNRSECLLIISPFIECKKFDMNKFDGEILSDPWNCILFLHSNNFINLQSCHSKLFHKCCEYGHILTVEYCLKYGVPVNSCSNRAIRDAASKGHLKIVQLLHKKGANIHQYKDEALRKAARHGHMDVVTFLHENGANIHSKNSESLRWSVANGHINICDYLIEHGIQKNENISITNTAIKYEQYECLSLLIKYGYPLFDKKLREYTLNALHKKDQDVTSSDDTESSVSPTYSFSCSVSPVYSSSSSSSSSLSPSPIWMNNDENDTYSNERFLDSISEGLALRETILVSILTQYVYDEIAFIICLYEKLALTLEDEELLDNMNKNKNNKYKQYKRKS